MSISSGFATRGVAAGASVSAHNSCNEFDGPTMLTIGSDSMGGRPCGGDDRRD